MRQPCTQLLIALAFLFITKAQAVSFLSFDSRTMAFGGAGTASARASEAIIFNPALLTSNPGLMTIKPHIKKPKNFLNTYAGARLLDRDKFIERAENFSEKNKEGALDDSLANIHALFESANLETHHIDKLIVDTHSILNDIQALSHSPLRVAASYGVSLGHQLSSWGFGITSRRYVVLGAQLNISSQDILRIQQILSTVGAMASVLEKTATLETLIKRTNFDDIIALIEEDARHGAVSDQLRNYNDIPSVSGVIDAIDDLTFSIDDLDQYIDMSRFFDALVAQNNGEQLQDIGLGHVDIRNYLRYQIPETLSSTIDFSGADIDEVSIGLAKRFESHPKYAIGITLKHQRIDAIGFNQPIQDINFSDYQNPVNRTQHTRFNIDIGMTYDLSPTWVSGVIIKNLLPYQVQAPQGQAISIDTIARMAIAYKTKHLLWTMDYDLTRNEPLGFDPDKQYLSSGLAIRLWKLNMIRLGYRYNTINRIGVPSLGLGIGFERGHIDIAATASDSSDEYGVSLQLGFSL